jgi:ribosome-binding ATPase YchF (GTP1/OBG family)
VKRPVFSIFFALLAVLSCPAQTADHKEEPQQMLALVKEVQAQQAQIVANQAKIEAKLAELAETMRTARIYSSRSR